MPWRLPIPCRISISATACMRMVKRCDWFHSMWSAAEMLRPWALFCPVLSCPPSPPAQPRMLSQGLLHLEQARDQPACPHWRTACTGARASTAASPFSLPADAGGLWVSWKHTCLCMSLDDTHPMPGTKPQQLVLVTVQSPTRKAHRLLAEVLCRDRSNGRALCCCNARPQSINAVPSTRYAVSPLQASEQGKLTHCSIDI